MPSVFSWGAIALTVTSFIGPALGVRDAVPEVFKRKSRYDARDQLAKRFVCYDDDILASFQEWRNDTEPFCRDYIDIPDSTAVATSTTRVTVFAIATATLRAGGVGTVASNTVTATITAAPALAKRQGLVPATEIIASCTESLSPQNASLISAVSSACTCIFATPDTVTVSTTVINTRTVSGIDYQQITETTSTVTTGQATTFYTVPRLGPNDTFIAGSTGAPLPFTTLASVTVSPSENTTTTASDFNPTLGSIIAPPRGGSDLPSTATDASSGLPASPSNYTIPPYTTPSAVPTTPTNDSTPTTSGAGPSSTWTSGECPVQNGSTYSTNGQTYEISCFTELIDVDDQGLFVPDLYTCIDDCAIANVGFSQAQCYGISFIPNNNVGPDCFFKTLNGTRHAEFNPKSTSAVLINNTHSTNSTPTEFPLFTPSALPTNSVNSTGPAPYPTGGVTSNPYEIPISANATTSGSATVTEYANITTEASAFPTLSINSSEIPVPPFPANPTDPRNGGVVPSTGMYSSGIAYPTAYPSTGDYSTGFPAPTGNSSILSTGAASSGFPSPTGNYTSSCGSCNATPATVTETLATVTETETGIVTVSEIVSSVGTVTVTETGTVTLDPVIITVTASATA